MSSLFSNRGYRRQKDTSEAPGEGEPIPDDMEEEADIMDMEEEEEEEAPNTPPETPTDIIVDVDLLDDETTQTDPKAIRMEKLRKSIDKQEKYLNLIAGNYLKHLATVVENMTASHKPIPLAVHTRHYRLGRILQVMEDLTLTENQLYSWYAALPSHDPNENDMHNEVHELIMLIERESAEIAKDWGGSDTQFSANLKSNYSWLEKRMARLHDSVEAMLMQLQELVTYLDTYSLLPLHDRMLETVKFYGTNLYRTDQNTLALMRTKSLKAKKNSYSMLDVHKIDMLVMSLPSKYIFTDKPRG